MVMPTTVYRLSMPSSEAGRIEWAWTEALAMARPGTSYRITRVPFTLAQESCRKLGCAEGEVLRCTGNGGGNLVLERADGSRVVVDRAIAWFIQVEVSSAGGPSPH